MTAIESAQRLRELHAIHKPLVFANIWDAASAKIVEAAGFPAVATGSAGVAFALGYADREQVPQPEMFAAVARIVRVVNVPVTADIEAGYGDIRTTSARLIEAGAGGMNLEDYENGELVPLDAQLERIRIARSTGLFVNARTDIYLEKIGPEETRLERTIARLRGFEGAGADCLFVPGVRDERIIEQLVRSAGVPLNILASAGSPSIARLRDLGVGRVSVGSGPMRATMALMRRIATELRDRGTYEAFTTDTIAYDDMNAMFDRGQ